MIHHIDSSHVTHQTLYPGEEKTNGTTKQRRNKQWYSYWTIPAYNCKGNSRGNTNCKCKHQCKNVSLYTNDCCKSLLSFCLHCFVSHRCLGWYTLSNTLGSNHMYMAIPCGGQSALLWHCQLPMCRLLQYGGVSGTWQKQKTNKSSKKNKLNICNACVCVCVCFFRAPFCLVKRRPYVAMDTNVAVGRVEMKMTNAANTVMINSAKFIVERVTRFRPLMHTSSQSIQLLLHTTRPFFERLFKRVPGTITDVVIHGFRTDHQTELLHVGTIKTHRPPHCPFNLFTMIQMLLPFCFAFSFSWQASCLVWGK